MTLIWFQFTDTFFKITIMYYLYKLRLIKTPWKTILSGLFGNQFTRELPKDE